MTTSVHLIEKLDNFKLVDSDNAVWESGWWKIPIQTAEKLVGGNIFFHKKQASPSFRGGIILGYRIETEGQYQGRIIFKFRECQDFCGIDAGTGWSMEKKIVT